MSHDILFSRRERRRERGGEKREREREGHTALTLFFLAIFGTTLRVQLFLKELRDFYEDRYARVLVIDFISLSNPCC